MYDTVNFSRTTHFTGRNGTFKATALEIMNISEDNVMLTPITSKGRAARCDIWIPREDIPAVIDLLQQVYHSTIAGGHLEEQIQLK